MDPTASKVKVVDQKVLDLHFFTLIFMFYLSSIQSHLTRLGDPGDGWHLSTLFVE